LPELSRIEFAVSVFIQSVEHRFCNELGAPMGDQVQRGEFLKDTDGIRRTENRYGACQANIFCASSPPG
jgi:hypothetical protein